MAFKPFRDERPMSQRPIEVQIEAEMFGLIRTFLSKKDQGRVMGAFREVVSKVKVTPKHTVEVPWTWGGADVEAFAKEVLPFVPSPKEVSPKRAANAQGNSKHQPSSKCLDDARKALGKYPYNEGTNYLVGDGYFSRSCRDKYGDRMWDEACEIVRKER